MHHGHVRVLVSAAVAIFASVPFFTAQARPLELSAVQPISMAFANRTAVNKDGQVDEPAGEKPAGEKPAGEKPAGEKPAGEKPAGEKPAGEKPAGEKPAGEKPAGEKPAGEKPAGEKPAEEMPAEEEPAEIAPADPRLKALPEQFNRMKGELKNLDGKVTKMAGQLDKVLKKLDSAPLPGAAVSPARPGRPAAAVSAAGSSTLWPVPRVAPDVPYAPVVHTLICALTDDTNPADGPLIGVGATLNQSYLEDMFTALSKNDPTRYKVYASLTGSKFSVGQVLRTIDSMTVGPEDAIFMHISTHGGYDATLGHYFSVSGSHHVGRLLRSQVMERLRQKRPRLIVLISDSCADFVSFPTVGAVAAPPSPEYSYPILELLFQFKGELSVNAAGPGLQTLYYVASSPQPGGGNSGGGIFTKCLCTSAEVGRAITSWQALLNDTARNVRNETTDGRQSQPCVFDQAGRPHNLAGRPLVNRNPQPFR